MYLPSNIVEEILLMTTQLINSCVGYLGNSRFYLYVLSILYFLPNRITKEHLYLHSTHCISTNREEQLLKDTMPFRRDRYRAVKLTDCILITGKTWSQCGRDGPEMCSKCPKREKCLKVKVRLAPTRPTRHACCPSALTKCALHMAPHVHQNSLAESTSLADRISRTLKYLCYV